MKTKISFPRLIPLLIIFASMIVACEPEDVARLTALVGPRTWLDQPFDGLTLPVAPYTLKAHARDLSGVTRITFFINDTPLGTVPTDSAAELAYAELMWNPSVPGDYTVIAVAANSAGAETSSEPARVCIGSSCPGAPLILATPTRTVPPPPPPASSCSGTPVIASFTVAPASITAGGSATLSWSVTNASRVEITEIGEVATTGTRSVSPATSTTYILVAICGSKENFAEKSITITVTGAKTCAGLPVVSSFTATPTSLPVGASSTLRWAVTNADRVELTTIGEVVANASRVVSPRTTTTYRLDAFCGGKENLTSRSVTITIVQPTPTRTRTPLPPPPPPPPPQGCSGVPNIASFSVSPNSITAGSSATLSWGAVTNADSVSIDPGIGGVATPGSTSVSPGGTTTYTLTARCGQNTATRQVTLTVQGQQPPPPPSSSSSALPQPPAAPTSLTLKSRSCSTPDQVQITWIDNSNNESGFSIYRRMLTGQSWGAWALRTNVGANTTQFSDTSGFSAGHRLEYYVQAYNAGGTSAQSNTLSATECPF